MARVRRIVDEGFMSLRRAASAVTASTVPPLALVAPDARPSGMYLRGAVRDAYDSRADALSSLVDRTQEGDRVATAELVKRLTPPLRRYLRRTLTAYEDIEDALQDSLLAVLSALPGFRGEASLVHFAIQVAHRSALSRRRSLRRHGDRSARLAQLELPLVTPSPEPHESSVEGRCHLEIRKLVRELPAVHSEAMALAIVCELTLSEVADATGVPINTVRSRLRRARRWLRSRIEADSVLAELFRQ